MTRPKKTEERGILGWSEVRRLKNIYHKLVYLSQVCGISQRTVGRMLSVSRNVVRASIKAKRELRDMGRKGRPPYLNENDSQILILKIKEQQLKRQALTRTQVKKMVFRSFLIHF